MRGDTYIIKDTVGRLDKLKREAIKEANKRVLGEQSKEEVNKYIKDNLSPKDTTGRDETPPGGQKERGITTQSSTPQNGKEIKVKWTHVEPYPRTNWDSVHAFEKSNTQDDFIDRIGNKLESGNYRIKDIIVGSEIKGWQVTTTAEAILVTDDNNPHRRITTRGSIGWYKTLKGEKIEIFDAESKADATKRHDEQLTAGIGLKKKLENAYGGTAERIGGQNVGHYYDIVLPNDKRKWYKQSFYGVTDH